MFLVLDGSEEEIVVVGSPRPPPLSYGSLLGAAGASGAAD